MAPKKRQRTDEKADPACEVPCIANMKALTPGKCRHYLHHSKQHAVSVHYTPVQLARFYNFPAKFTGKGTTVALIELGGGYSWAPIKTYFKQLGLSVPTPLFVSVDGAKNKPDGPNGAQGEVELDMCVVGGMAPDAKMRVYMAPNTNQSFAKAIQQAVDDDVDVISISWGAPERNWDSATIQEFEAVFAAAAKKKIVVCAAAGDNGSGDGEPGKNVDYPASSPGVLGCGGTSLRSMNPIDERVWNDGLQGGATGGGVSIKFPLPPYQSSVAQPALGSKRMVPDIAAVADPETGWFVSIAGRLMAIGGTSAVAPMMAAFVACSVEAKGRTGFINPTVYGTYKKWARDILVGNNGAFQAKAGYDCCTGVGVPNAANLLSNL